MKERILIAVLAILLCAAPAGAAGKNARQVIMALTEVAVSVPITVTIDNPRAREGYFVFTTANETPSASLIVTVFNSTPLGDFLVCTTTAVTTNSQWTTLLGSSLTAADGVDQACIFPISRRVKFVFTVTGDSSDFDVTADMEWLTD